MIRANDMKPRCKGCAKLKTKCVNNIKMKQVRGLHGKYENTIKDHAISIRQPIGERGLLSAEREKVVRELREKIMINIMYITIK